MKNLILAQLFQLRRKKAIAAIFVMILAILLLNLWLMREDVAEPMTASYYIAVNSYYMMTMSMVFVLFLTGEICAADFVDKTLNYEVMGGYSRGCVFASRVVLSLVSAVVSAVVLWAVPVLAAAASAGWGDTLILPEAVGRLFLALFPTIRIVCEFIALSYLIKNSFIVQTLAAFVSILGSMLVANTDSVFLGYANLASLFRLEYFRLYTLSDLKFHVIYSAAVRASEAVSTVAASVLLGGLALLIAYVYFQRDDLN